MHAHHIFSFQRLLFLRRLSFSCALTPYCSICRGEWKEPRMLPLQANHVFVFNWHKSQLLKVYGPVKDPFYRRSKSSKDFILSKHTRTVKKSKHILLSILKWSFQGYVHHTQTHYVINTNIPIATYWFEFYMIKHEDHQMAILIMNQ